MADYNVPADLLDAQRAFYTADELAQEIADAMPSSVAIAAGEATIPDEQRQALEEARAERGRLIDVLYGPHHWWGTVGDKYAARMALQQAAKS